MDSKTIKFYNENADQYSAWRFKEGKDKTQATFLEHLGYTGHILDLGCGTGEKALWFRKNGLTITAIDASKEMLKYLQKVNGISSFQMDITDLDLDEKFDGIWASFSLQHLKKTDQDILIKDIPTLLKKAGIFYLGIHEGNQSYRDELGRLYVPRTESDLEYVLSTHKLSIIEIFKEKTSSFDGKPINVMHIFSQLSH